MTVASVIAVSLFGPRFSASENVAEGPHIGFTTPRALGNAVVRNRIRRRLREAVRFELESLSPEWSIVFNPRRKAIDCPLPDLQAEVKRLFLRLSSFPRSSFQEKSSRPAASSSSSSPDTSV